MGIREIMKTMTNKEGRQEFQYLWRRYLNVFAQFDPNDLPDLQKILQFDITEHPKDQTKCVFHFMIFSCALIKEMLPEIKKCTFQALHIYWPTDLPINRKKTACEMVKAAIYKQIVQSLECGEESPVFLDEFWWFNIEKCISNSLHQSLTRESI